MGIAGLVGDRCQLPATRGSQARGRLSRSDIRGPGPALPQGPSFPFPGPHESPPTKMHSTLSGGIPCSVLQAGTSEAAKQYFTPLNSL